MRGLGLLLLVLAVSCVGTPRDEDALTPVHARLESEQDVLDLGAVDVGWAREGTASFRNPGNAATNLSAHVEPEGSPFTVLTPSAAAAPDRHARVTVRFLAFTEGSASAVLVVRHDGEADANGSRTLRVELRALALPPPNCDDGNVCTLDQQDPAVPGACRHLPVAGTCDDGNVCTLADHCEGGECLGTPRVCDDGIACTADTCDAVAGCLSTPVATLCADEDPCTSDVCAPGAGADAAGCIHEPSPTGTLCGSPSCGALPVCVAGACVATTAPDGFPCDDGNACTGGETCQAGVCMAGSVSSFVLGTPVVLREIALPETPPVQSMDAGVSTVDGGGAWECDDGACGVPPTTPSPQPLFGSWPIAVDAMATVPTYSVEGYNLLTLWRGAEGYEGSWCYSHPASCAQRPPHACEPVYAVMPVTTLNASMITPSGEALSRSTLSLEAVYRRAMAFTSWPVGPESSVPPGNILGVAAAGHMSSAPIGAAVAVDFNSRCAPCGDAPVDGCAPAGEAVAVVLASMAGFHLSDVIWLGDDGDGAFPDVLVRGPDGLPLMAAWGDDAALEVAFATVGTEPCNPVCSSESCECHNNVTLHVRSYEVAYMDGLPTARFTSSNEIPLVRRDDVVTGGLSSLRLVDLGGMRELTWLERSTVTPPSVDCALPVSALWDLWRTPVGQSTAQGPQVHHAGVMDAQLAFGTRAFNAVLSWAEPTTSCELPQVLTSDHGGAVQELMRHTLPGVVVEGLELVVANGTPHVVAVHGDGLVTAMTLTAEVTTATGGFNPSDDARIHPQSPLRPVWDDWAFRAVGGIAEVGIYRDSFPLPAMVVMPAACGP
ncbi:MAG: EB domain-containing protein [Myxococcota bacterium]